MSTRAQFEVVRDLSNVVSTEATAIESEASTYANEVEAKIGAAGADAWGGTHAEAVKPVLAALRSDLIQLNQLGEDLSNDANRSMAGLQQQGNESVQTINNVYNKA